MNNSFVDLSVYRPIHVQNIFLNMHQKRIQTLDDMLDRSSDFQNKLQAKTVTKDFCSQNNQLYLCVLIQRP